VQVQLYQNYLLKSNFIRKNFSLEFIKTLCHKLKEQNYSPEENLYSKGKMPNRLIIIISGSVQSYVPGQCNT
jgi:CRP-like cAMP-binding protein